ncbi:acetylglutamate kinase [uncultured Eubacterium sp.]|uniref:acetylglutamate kinase n=1 Tax=uncultured Eubacterium sp. TaxID=165185 RepID=UPI0015B0556B|nr:acetylglutamate kinase [uncultured Eubacterium sp.]
MGISNITNSDRSEILVQALPYIQKYQNKTVVIKYGGNAMINEELRDAVMTDIVLLRSVGVNVVLVHGGGPEISDMLNRVGKQNRFVDGLRYTDKETVDIVQMVLAGKVNKHLVQLISKHGGKAVGLCGIDGEMIKAEKYTKADIGFVGEITEVNTDIINDNLQNGYIPVISSVATGENDEVYNINADTAAASLAAGLRAEKLLLMTDISGLLMDKNDETTLIHDVQVSQIPSLKSQGVISGGMIPKIDCCVEAVRQGVLQTNIIDGRIPHSILMELFTDEGFGTMLHA